MSVGYHLTFDIDWAPDWSVRETLELLAETGAPATFFATHASPVVEEIAAAGHEVGVHPNFQPGSTQGAGPVDIMGQLLELVPAARVMRTHGLIQGSLLLRDVLKAHPQLEYDMSLLTYRFPHAAWFGWRLGGAGMQRINYVWEDDFAFEDVEQDWREYQPISAVDVLDFHPIHVSLNSRSGQNYERVKEILGSRPLTQLTREETAGLQGSQAGTRDFLRAVLASSAKALSFEELLCV